MRISLILATAHDGTISVVGQPTSDVKGNRQQFKRLVAETKDGGAIGILERWESDKGRVSRKRYSDPDTAQRVARARAADAEANAKAAAARAARAKAAADEAAKPAIARAEARNAEAESRAEAIEEIRRRGRPRKI